MKVLIAIILIQFRIISLVTVRAFHPSTLFYLNHKCSKERFVLQKHLQHQTLNESFVSECHRNDEYSRHSFIQHSVRTIVSSIFIESSATAIFPKTSNAAEINQDHLIDVYFGCGCFWHVQHEFIQAERRILNRSDEELTARTGYAGGKAGALDGKVCYHNGKGISDYGKLGHAEVVHLRIPPSSYTDFAIEYTKLFDRNGYRPDQLGDRGSEYRNLVGFPGGANADNYLQQLLSASKENGDKLAFTIGEGSDADQRALVYIMDSSESAYPFFVAEAYHQFHNGFAPGEKYPKEYNAIAEALSSVGKLSNSKCPTSRL
jgi:peptide methionine sulfoxide reductase MsrA